MAYKFQLGDAIMSGALTQEEGLTVKAGGATITAGGLSVVAGGATVTAGDMEVTAGDLIVIAGIATLDGGVNVNSDNFTVADTGAVVSKSTISGSGAGSFNGGLTLGAALALQSKGITAAGALAGVTTLTSTGLASLDGGIDVNGTMTVSTAGAIAGATTVDGSGDLTMGTITMTGFAVDADGDTNLKSLAVDDGSTIGNDSDLDLMTLTTGKLTIAGVLSASTGLGGLDLLIAPGKSIGVVGDVDLLTLDVNSFVVAGTAAMTGLTASSGTQLQGALEVQGSVFLPGASVAVFDVGDLVYFMDADGAVKRDSWADVMTATAGGGITATAGVLSADSAATPNKIGDLSVNLVEGFNYATASLSAARTFTLPASPTAGDTVHVKLMGGVSSTNYGAITGSAASAANYFLIDGRTDAIRLESLSGAVSLTWTGTNAVGWAIY
jgi:hypothetical protein